MKATKQDFPVVLFIMLYKVALILKVCGWNPPRKHGVQCFYLRATNQMKATKQYFL